MSSEEEKQERPGFTVRDRRRFSESGDARPDREVAAEEAHPADSAAAAATSAAAGPAARQAAAPPVEINFSTFVISLSTQALAHLGEIPNPVDQQSVVDLTAAKQLIDILGILKDKTNGNLEKPETELLEGLLYDLRIRYVERVRARSQGA